MTKFHHYPSIFFGNLGGKNCHKKPWYLIFNNFQLCALFFPQLHQFTFPTFFKVRLYIFYWSLKFHTSIGIDFGFTLKSIIEKRLNLAKCQTLKLYDFSSSFPIYFKFSPDITHCKTFLSSFVGVSLGWVWALL